MGKRELLLIGAFIVVGAIVYQVTAPPSGPNQRGLGDSVSNIVNEIRRELRGNRSRAEVTTPTTHALDAAVTDLRLRVGTARVAVVGEDRADLHVEMHVRSTGYDEAEAQQLARQTKLKVDNAGATVILTIQYPEPGSQTAALTVKVPSRLRVRADQSGPLKVSNVAEVELALARGDTTIERISGRVSGTHRGGTLTLLQIGSARLTGRGSDLRINGLRGDLAVNLQTGQLRATDVIGPIEIDATQAEITLEKIEKLRGTLRINASGGAIAIKGLRTEARIDGRNTDVEIALDQPVPLAVYNDGEDDIVLTPPAGGYRLDAVARDGKLSVPASVAAVTTEANEQRANAAIGGGGPTITLRANRGDIVVRAREIPKSDVER